MCPKCGIVIQPKIVDEEVFTECPNCGFKKEFTDWFEHYCNLCGGNKAIIVFNAQTKGDEDATTILRCIKCGATEKEGYKG